MPHGHPQAALPVTCPPSSRGLILNNVTHGHPFSRDHGDIRHDCLRGHGPRSPRPFCGLVCVGLPGSALGVIAPSSSHLCTGHRRAPSSLSQCPSQEDVSHPPLPAGWQVHNKAANDRKGDESQRCRRGCKRRPRRSLLVEGKR